MLDMRFVGRRLPVLTGGSREMPYIFALLGKYPNIQNIGTTNTDSRARADDARPLGGRVKPN